MLWLADASRHDYGTSGGSWTDTSDPKGCLHTTEGGSWPAYDSGQKAPHATVLPIPGKGVEIRQHIAFDRAARALRNPAGGVQTNRDYVFQFELIGTCAKGGPGYYWTDADDAVLADLYAKVIHPVSQAFGIPEIAPPWLAYPASYGNSRVRMSGAQFDHYSGWLGHQHVPENDHGDPGDFPWSRMIAAAGGGTQEDEVTPEDIDKIADQAASALLKKSVQVGLEQWTVAQAIGRAAANSRNAVTALDSVADPERIAAVVREAFQSLPQGVQVTQEQVTTGIYETVKRLVKEAQ